MDVIFLELDVGNGVVTYSLSSYGSEENSTRTCLKIIRPSKLYQSNSAFIVRAPGVYAGMGGYGLDAELVDGVIVLMSSYSIPQKSPTLIQRLVLHLPLLMKGPSKPDSYIPELLHTSEKLLQKRFPARIVWHMAYSQKQRGWQLITRSGGDCSVCRSCREE